MTNASISVTPFCYLMTGLGLSLKPSGLPRSMINQFSETESDSLMIITAGQERTTPT